MKRVMKIRLSRYKTGMIDLDFWYLVFSESNILSLILITGTHGTEFNNKSLVPAYMQVVFTIRL